MTEKQRPDFFDAAKALYEEHYADANVGFVAGSIVRGEGTKTSDIDLVILYDEWFQDVRRESLIYQGWPVEVFIHNVKAQDWFCNNDTKRRHPTLPAMIVEDIEIPAPTDLSRQQKEKAQKILDAGPPALTKDEIDFKRYMLTDLLDDLVEPKSQAEQRMILARLYQNLADFYLLAHGKWTGVGKHLTRRLAQEFPEISDEYETAFTSGFQGNTTPLFPLVDKMLEPFGGRFWEGYSQKAPDDWKKT